MKVVYLHQYFNTPAMSGGTRSYEMARRLVRWGHEVHVVTSKRSSDELRNLNWSETLESGIHVHWTPVPYSNCMSYSDRVRAFVRFAWRAARRAAALRGDVVFATSTPLTIALPGIYASLRCRTPFVFEVRDLWPELPIAMGALKNPLSIAAARTLESLAYRHASHIVALSPGMKEGIVRRGVAPENVSVIPNSCDFELFEVPESEGEAFRREQDWLGDRPLIVYCGTLGSINGVNYLARLAAATGRLDPNMRFLVVGAGQQEASIRREARSLGVLDVNFFMRGPISKQDVPRILSAANIATSLFMDLPQMAANSANKFFDALAAGRPVAINHEGWLADLVRERKLGIVLDPIHVATAAAVLVRFVRNPPATLAAAQSARHTARRLFDREVLARQFEAVLQATVGKSVVLPSVNIGQPVAA